MNGVDIIGALVGSDPAIVAMVPLARIKAELLPDGVQLPALLVRDISSVERQSLKRGPTVRTTERVSVTVRAKSLRERRAVLKLVVARCAGALGTIAGASSVSVLTAGRGPGLIGPGNSFEQTQDFRVTFDAAASSTAPGGGAASGGSAPTTPIDSLDWAP